MTSGQPSLGDFEQANTDLNKEWERVVFSDVISINDYPSAQKGEEYRSVGMSDVGRDQRKIEDWEYKGYSYSRPRFKNGQTLMARITPCLENGKTAFVDLLDEDEVAVGSTEFIVLSGSEKILPKFVYYTARRPEIRQFAIKRMTGTSGRQRVPLDIFDNKKIRLPSKEEQKKIVAVLDSLDSKIEINSRINTIFEDLCHTLFNSWFVDFEPNDEFKNSELGSIPKSFNVGTLGELMKKKTEGVDPEKVESTAPYFSLKHMPEKSIQLDNWGVADDISSRKYQFAKGDILFGKLRPYFCKVGPAPVDGVCSTDIFVITPAKSNLWKEFLIFQLSDSSFIDYCDKVSTGTRMPRVGWKDMCEYQIAIPPKEEIKRFHRQIKLIIQKATSNIHESKTLDQARDTLLPKLMSGEVGVNDLELDELEVDSEV